MQRRSALLFSLASCALLCFSCAGEPAPSEQEASLLHEVEGQVIARVNGEAISRPELEAMMQRRGLDERAALQALIELHALSQEAGAHGAEEQLPVRIAHDRALVQRLLTLQVEASNTEDKVESSLIQRVYDDFGLEIFVPEQVTVSHVLLFVPAQPTPAQLEQVMGIAAEIRAALSPPVDDERLLELAWLANLRGFPAIVERDLTFPQHPVRPLSGKESRYKSMVPAFANAAFALSEAEPLSDPVRTEYGVHIISFKRRLPGHRPSLDLVSDEIRREIANFRRASGVDALLAERRKSASIEVDDELLRSIATSLSLGTQ